MRVTPTRLPEVLLLEPRTFGDARGRFHEAFHADRYAAAGIVGPWIQDNISRSRFGVLRGLHYQWPNPQGKLVSVLNGRIFDVAVDLRRSSPRFGQWAGVELDDEACRQLWVPPGFAHGFLVMSERADVLYKCSLNAWSPSDERVLRHDDPEIGIHWPGEIKEVNARDANAPGLGEQELLPE